ncbi:MAG: 30S ribosomal protein S20 [Thiomonas sp.]|jgi:small subunit ribosomal protein S20
MATKAAAKKKSVRTPSGRKRARQAIKANAANKALRSRFRTAVKSVRKAIASGDHAKAMEVFRANVSVIDSIADKKIFHKNVAARHKSRLNAAIKALAA